MNLVDKEYYEQYFEQLTYARKIEFLELYEEYSCSKMEVLLNVILLFQFNVFKKEFKNYQTHVVLSGILFVLWIINLIITLFLVISLVNVVAAVIMLEILTFTYLIYGFFAIACRIFSIVKINNILEMSNMKAKEQVIQIMEGAEYENRG